MYGKTIFWIYGSSAVGKGTFIDRAIKGIQIILDDQNIITFNNLSYSSISKQNIHHNGANQSEGDMLVKGRSGIINEVLSLVNKGYSNILIKGQDYDINNRYPIKLKEKLHDFKHIIIFIHDDIDNVYSRYANDNEEKTQLQKQKMTL